MLAAVNKTVLLQNLNLKRKKGFDYIVLDTNTYLSHKHKLLSRVKCNCSRYGKPKVPLHSKYDSSIRECDISVLLGIRASNREKKNFFFQNFLLIVIIGNGKRHMFTS